MSTSQASQGAGVFFRARSSIYLLLECQAPGQFQNVLKVCEKGSAVCCHVKLHRPGAADIQQKSYVEIGCCSSLGFQIRLRSSLASFPKLNN